MRSPPPERIGTVPSQGTRCSESFQPISCDSAAIAASGKGTELNVPSTAMPVDWLL